MGEVKPIIRNYKKTSKKNNWGNSLNKVQKPITMQQNSFRHLYLICPTSRFADWINFSALCHRVLWSHLSWPLVFIRSGGFLRFLHVLMIMVDILCRQIRRLVWSVFLLFILRLLNFTLCRPSEDWCTVDLKRTAIGHVCQLLVLPHANTLAFFELFTSRIAVLVLLF